VVIIIYRAALTIAIVAFWLWLFFFLRRRARGTKPR